MGAPMSVTVFQPSTRDVTINSFGGGDGTSPTLSVTQNIKLLFYFDLSSIDSSDICSSAILTLRNSSNNYAIVIDAYAIKSGNSGWNESATNTTINGATAWSGSDWCGTAGTDYDSTPIGSDTAEIGFFVESSWDLTPSVIRTWFGLSNSNYGLFLTTSSLNSNFYYMREETTSSYRPKLTVTHFPTIATDRRSISSLGTRVGTRSSR